MTIIVPELSPSADKSTASFALPTNQPTKPINHHDKDNENNNQLEHQQTQPLYQSTSLKSALKTTSKSISLVISKTTITKETDIDDSNEIDGMDTSSSLPGSGAKVVSRGRRRSVDKQYRPSQPTGNNNGGGRTSARRSGRSYQNYDNNSSNGNSGADGNGEDNDDSDDDEDDEYIDEDDDDEDEEEEEEDEEDEDKNEDDDDEEDKNNGVDNSIDEKVLASFGLKLPGDSSVDTANIDCDGPIPTGTPITLQGIVCHETLGGVLVVNIKWRNKIYCGSLMDCTRHSWARPRFQSNDGTTHTGKTRLSQAIGRGKGKGQGQRLRSNSVTSINSNVSTTVSPLKQKLRGRKKTISGSSTDKRQGFRSSKRKPKNDEDSDDSLRPGKRSCTVKGAPSPQPSPTLIECPEPGCEKKYKHINGLRYHQAHAHLESKNQDDDNNFDDRSSTTPSPSEEFKEPDPLTTSKGKASYNTTKSISESSSATSSEKDSISSDIKPTENNENIPSTDSKDMDDKKSTDTKGAMATEETIETLTEIKVENVEVKIEETEPVKDEKQDKDNASEFVVVADKSTDTSSVTMTTYSCTKHSVIPMATVVPANEVPEVADTQEVWETVLDSGCVTTAVVSDDKKMVIDEKLDSCSKERKDEGRQVLITTSGMNQLGIEVEDISENEEDIDPGQDVEFNSREEMEMAVENLQSSSYVTSLSTENNFEMLSSLKDPSLIFGLTNRERLLDDKECSDSVVADPTLESITARPNETIAETTKEVTTTTTVPVSCSMSFETLVSRSITASKHEPPLTNADTPSSRFKYFPCRNYGDETYSVSTVTNTNTTTLSLIRDREFIKTESTVNKPDIETSIANHKSDNMAEITKPSYTGSSGFSQDCTTTSIHSHGPKEKLKELQATNGDILSTNTLSSERQATGRSLSLYTSPKSSTAATFNTVLNTSPSVSTTASKDSKSSTVNSVSSDNNQSKDLITKSESQSGREDKKDEGDKSSFGRQPSALMSKHSRPSIPSLPIGVAHPYLYGNVVTPSSGLSASSNTDLPRSDPLPPSTASTTATSKSDDLESRVLPKDKPVGEVGPVNVKRPAIHAGLPTVIPAGAPGLKTQSSLHVPIRQGLKPPGLEERALTPNSLRLAASSPRSNTTSPLPTSPRLSPKIPITESKPSKLTTPTSSASKPTNSSADVVIVKQENEPTSSKVSRDTEREKKTSPYEIPKEQLTPEQIQYYQMQHRQMMFAQASMDRFAYMRNFGYEIGHGPWAMSPEQIKVLQHQQQQQHQRLRAAEEERLEAVKRSKEESSKAKLEKRESRSPMTSTPPRLERVMRDLSPGEGSRSVTATSESSSRGVPSIEPPPEKKSKLDTPKGDETDRELQKLRHKRHEEYLSNLSKQSMQHKFTMLKQLENVGGAAKTHTIPPLLENKDDYQKTNKHPSTSTHSEVSNQSLDKPRKSTTTNDPDESSQLDLASRSRDPRDVRDSRDSARDLHSKAKMRDRGAFVPTQFQEYLKHSQHAAASGNPMLIPGHLDPSYVVSRMKDRDSTSPYKSTSPRPPRPRSPTSSHRTSPYKTDRSSSQSISPHRISRPSYGEVYGSSSSRSSIFSRADKSPPQQTDRHKDIYVSSGSSSSSSSRPVITETTSQSSRTEESKHSSYRSQDRLKEEALRPGIISTNLAVRRGDVTTSMLMQGHGHTEEELIRRHPYVMYSPYSRSIMDHRQQQHAEQVYAMMSTAQQNAARAEQYFSKRQ